MSQDLEKLVKNGYHRIRGLGFFEKPMYKNDGTIAIYNPKKKCIEVSYTLPRGLIEDLPKFVREAERHYVNIMAGQAKTLYHGCINCPLVVYEQNLLVHYAEKHYKKKK